MVKPQFSRLERLYGALADNVILASALLVLLIILLAASMLWQIYSVREDLDHVTRERVQKLQVITDLLEAAYNRHVSLVNFTLSKDPFERDEYVMAFHGHGFDVGQARTRFREMRLDDFETKNMAEQDGLIQDIVKMQNKALELAQADDLEAAQALLSGELRKLDGRYDRTIEALRQYEAREIEVASDKAQAQFDSAVRHSLILSALAVGLAVFISIAVRRQLRLRTRQIAENLDALRLSQEQLRHEASHDPLTQLANRNLFYQRVEEAISTARENGREAAVLYLDMDHFKPVNDNFGHGVGDLLLKVVAQRLKASVRQKDTVARLGGDEFALLLTDLHPGDDYIHIREAVLQRLSSPVSLAGHMIEPKGSLGIALYPRDGDNVEALLAVADKAMFEIKRQRKEGEA